MLTANVTYILRDKLGNKRMKITYLGLCSLDVIRLSWRIQKDKDNDGHQRKHLLKYTNIYLGQEE